MASTAKQAKGLKWLFWTGFYSAVLAFMSLFVAFASPYWIQSWRRVHSPLANTGLWQICLSGYIKPRDPTLSGYVGCWWIHTTVFHDISDSIMPPWFRMVQAFTIISLVMIVVAAVLVGLFRPEDTRNNLYGKLQHQLMYCNAALLLIPAAMIFIDSLVFAMKTKDPNWMPRPHLNYLSWSYGFNVLAGFFSAFAGICVTLIALILKDTRDKTDMPWQPKVEASKPVQSYPVRSYPQAPSEASERSYGTNSQVSQAYSGQHKPYQYYPTAAPIDRPKEQSRMTEKPYVAQYVPSSAPIQKSQPQHDYAPRKPYVAEYKPTKPPVESSYQAPPSRYANTPSYSQGYSVAVKRTPRTSNDDTKESDV